MQIEVLMWSRYSYSITLRPQSLKVDARTDTISINDAVASLDLGRT